MQWQITYDPAKAEDMEPIYQLCRQLILDYEDLESIDLDRVLKWVRKKIETTIAEYTAVSVDGWKAGYYRFCRNAEGKYELDDLYIFPEFQNKGLGTTIICKCCAQTDEPVMLYVFVRNHRAVSLYQRSGFRVIEVVNGTRYIMENSRKESHDEKRRTVESICKGI